MAAQDRTVLVTGAGTGIGLATLIELARRGFAPVGGVRTPSKARTITRAARAAHVKVGTVTLDVTNAKQCEAVIGGLKPFGLVNNAGVPASGAIEDVSDDDARLALETMVLGPMRLARLAVPHMRARGAGRIVNISSGAGRSVSLTGIQAYASAKAGQIGFTRQTAHELGRFGITVNCIAPGFVLSNPTTQRQWESYGEEGQRTLIERIATRRLGKPEDIANGVVFFVAEEASWVTGQTISIDGGHSIF